MTRSPFNFRRILLAVIAMTVSALSVQAADLSDKDKQFLAGYEKVHTALAADDLTSAKTAAGDLGDEGGEIANAASLKDARAGFDKITSHAKTLIAGQSGYYLVHCPMLKKDWVQISTTVANPYAGKAMVTCGEIKK